MKRKFFALGSALALAAGGFVAAAPTEAVSAGYCAWQHNDHGTKPARYTILVTCAGSNFGTGYGSTVYFYNSVNATTTYSTNSSQKVTTGTVQAMAGASTIYAYGGAWS
ncbi:MAG: hypothetical protein LBK72_00560 [Bifidobacteriaceae bacterium]|jgi:hypothetical protein|nr:hypothetical protein [Bifidobacteriaceae bacterium]